MVIILSMGLVATWESLNNALDVVKNGLPKKVKTELKYFPTKGYLIFKEGKRYIISI